MSLSLPQTSPSPASSTTSTSAKPGGLSDVLPSAIPSALPGGQSLPVGSAASQRMAALREQQKSALIGRETQPENVRARLPSEWKSLSSNRFFISDLRDALQKLSPEELARPSAIAATVKGLISKNLKFSAELPPLPATPHVLGRKGLSASIAYAGSEFRVEGQGVQPLWNRGGVAGKLTAQTDRSQGSRAALPVTGSGAFGVFHEVVPGSLAVFAGVAGSVGNSPVEISYGPSKIAAPNRLQHAAVGSVGPVATVEGLVTRKDWPVDVRVDATAYLPMATKNAFDFAGAEARGQHLNVRKGLQAQVGVTVSKDIALGNSMRFTPFARAEMPIADGGQPTMYAGFELGRSRNSRMPPSQPTIELSTLAPTTPTPVANAPTPTVAASTQAPLPTVSPRPTVALGHEADFGGLITLDRS